MEKIKIDPTNPSEENVKKVTDFFLNNGIVVYPTDTVYGIGCLATNKEAVAKIFETKKRPLDKPLLTLVSDLSMLKKYFYVDEQQEEYLKEYWPGPTSFLLEYKGNLDVDPEGKETGSVVRLPKNDFLIKMIQEVGTPITSTSLNINGHQPLKSVSDIENQIPTDNIDLVVDGGSLSGEASSIIDIRDINNIKRIR